jgi:hypothetical protein
MKIDKKTYAKTVKIFKAKKAIKLLISLTSLLFALACGYHDNKLYIIFLILFILFGSMHNYNGVYTKDGVKIKRV